MNTSGCTPAQRRASTSSGPDLPSLETSCTHLSWLAEDYVQLNEIARAAEIAKHVALLSDRADSARTDTRLKHLADLLRPHKDVTEVADFLDLYCALATGDMVGHDGA